MRVLELFSGTGSVSKICNERGWEVISLDLKDADINIDILKWNYKELYPVGYFDYIHASPPCDTFSNLRRCWLGRTIKKHGDKIITKERIKKILKSRDTKKSTGFSFFNWEFYQRLNEIDDELVFKIFNFFEFTECISSKDMLNATTYNDPKTQKNRWHQIKRQKNNKNAKY